MTSFYLAAATLVVVALALLLRPWWWASRRGVSADSLPALNAAIHRDRLGELERDRNNGALSAADLAEAREELQRQLLDDTAATEAVVGGGFGRGNGIAMAILLPLIAVGLYALLGSPATILPGAAATQRPTADMDQLVAKLAKKLEENPDNPEGWIMLARSYKGSGRFDEAEVAYGRIGPELTKSAELLAEFAELLVQKNNGFDDRSRNLVQQALRIEPNNKLALFMGGRSAFDIGRFAQAAAHWERLLPQLEAGSEDARMVESGIAEARQRSTGPQSGGSAPQQGAPRGVETAGQGAAKAVGSSVSGRVELSAALKGKAKPDDVVFIFARAVDGQRMPLAAQRARVADLPLEFMLDDSKALMPEANLSSASQVRIEVRVSMTGAAAPGKGDLTGQSAPVKPGAQGLRILIDRVEP